MKVEVINNTGGQVRQEMRRGPNGQKIWLIVIEETPQRVAR